MEKRTASGKLEWFVLTVLMGFTVIAPAGAQKPANPPPSQTKQESFWDKVLRYAGISHDASNLKAPGDEVVSGQVWMVDLGSRSTSKVTAEGGYRSPVFVPGGNEVLALKGAEVVLVKRLGGTVVKRYSLPEVIKLVGFSTDDPDTVLVLEGKAGAHPGVGLLSLHSGKITAMPYNAASSRDLQMIEHLQSWERVYGNVSLYTKRRSKETIDGTVEWTDVYSKRGNDEAVDVSQCDGVNCGQPSQSADGRYVVFVKSDND